MVPIGMVRTIGATADIGVTPNTTAAIRSMASPETLREPTILPIWVERVTQATAGAAAPPINRTEQVGFLLSTTAVRPRTEEAL